MESILCRLHRDEGNAGFDSSYTEATILVTRQVL